MREKQISVLDMYDLLTYAADTARKSYKYKKTHFYIKLYHIRSKKMCPANFEERFLNKQVSRLQGKGEKTEYRTFI
ncbi:Hypothetical predicted protein [Octopus vulgaris]|uniref:Uncharacterized protein n=1 Tax=Octopus vulgaris TaxID=6645 RepID=A0AA36FHP9_OCTVU|nr:Hypothetical predicted protein [Octopus vulgaris]